MSKIKENLAEVIPQENKATAYFDSYDGYYYYKCPHCDTYQDMSDLTVKEERDLEKGESIYYQCDTCETIAEVTYED